MSEDRSVYCLNDCEVLLEPKLTMVGGGREQDGWYCPSCGGEWTEEQNELEVESWKDCHFPLWIRVEHYDDDWKMLRLVSEKTGLDRHEIPGRDMRHCIFHVWFKVEDDGSVEGPYDTKWGEEI